MSYSSRFTQIGHETEPSNFLKENILFFLKRIHWIVLGAVLAVFLANIKLKYAVPYYQATAKVLFKNDENGGLFNESNAFQDIGFGYSYSPIENEIETLKSRLLMRKVVKDLKLNVVFYNNDGLIPVEEYENPTLKITFLGGDSSIYKLGAHFDIKITSPNTFTITNETHHFYYDGSFGKPFKTRIGEVILTPSDQTKELNAGKKITLWIYELENAVDMYVGGISINRPNEYSNVLEIELIDNSIQKAIDIVNNLIKQHQSDAIADKNQVAKNSTAFINERINIISKELSNVEGSVQNFKSNNSIVDVNTEANLFMETQQEIEKNIVDNEIQLKLAEYVNAYLNEKKKITDLLPTNLGLTDLSIEHSIETYNNIVLERNRILRNSNEKNPIALNLESKILNLQDNLKESLKKFEMTLKLTGRQLDLQNQKLTSQIASVPRQEKELREIQRQQQIKESLYLYLLQKREETAISLSLTVANSRVIDDAYSNGNVVSPSRKNTYLVALILGILIPFIILLILKTTNRKVKNVEEIEKNGLRVIAEIPKIKMANQQHIFSEGENNFFAESFRLLRTNVDFILGNYKRRNKTIIITSCIPNEGKSFVSLNLVKSLSLINKKVIILGMDLRSPILHKYLGLPQQKGISNYIIDRTISVKDIIVEKVAGHNFDMINSGDIPPNPAELLLNSRVTELFDELEKLYDYIVVDTAPIGIVTDTLLLNNYSDLFIFIVRNKYLDRKYLQYINKIRKEDKLKNINIVLNCSEDKASYGYQYGYYYGDEKVNFWTKLKKLFRLH